MLLFFMSLLSRNSVRRQKSYVWDATEHGMILRAQTTHTHTLSLSFSLIRLQYMMYICTEYSRLSHCTSEYKYATFIRRRLQRPESPLVPSSSDHNTAPRDVPGTGLVQPARTRTYTCNAFSFTP